MTMPLINKRQGVLRVKIYVWVPKNKKYVSADAIIDTGAHKTIIDEQLARLMKLPLNKKTSVTVTASGPVESYDSVLPKMRLGDKILANIPVSVMKLPDALKTRCLIGMNILQEFDINISNINATVRLTPNPLPKTLFIENYSITLVSVEDDSLL